MTLFIVHGAKIEVPDNCECGAVPSTAGIASTIYELNSKGDLCSFCGQPIKLATGTWKHFHKKGERPDRWHLSTWPDMESHWDWLESTPYGRFDIHAHISCAKAGMKYANFEGPVYNKPEIVPEGGLPADLGLDPCTQCGAVPTLEDAAKVAARLYSIGPGDCVYCGKAILLMKLTVSHFWWDGSHNECWQWDEWMREKMLHWCGWTSNETSKYISLAFAGHLECAQKAMPYMRRLEDLPKCDCK